MDCRQISAHAFDARANTCLKSFGYGWAILWSCFEFDCPDNDGEVIKGTENLDRAHIGRHGKGRLNSIMDEPLFLMVDRDEMIDNLTGALGSERYAAPEIIERNMAEGDIGLKTGRGFLDDANLDIDAYRRDHLKALVDMLGCMRLTRPRLLAGGKQTGLTPTLDNAIDPKRPRDPYKQTHPNNTDVRTAPSYSPPVAFCGLRLRAQSASAIFSSSR